MKILLLIGFLFSPLLAQSREFYINNLKNIKILQVFAKVNVGGAWTYKYELAKMLRSCGMNFFCLVSDLDKRQQLTQEGFKVLPTGGVATEYEKSVEQLTDTLYDVCKKHAIKLVHCHMPEEAAAARQVAKLLPIKVVVSLHSMFPHVFETTEGLDAVAAISPIMIPKVRICNTDAPRQPLIEWICPLFEDKKILQLRQAETRADFFKKNFGITVTNDPLICSVAHFYWIGKNHEVLLRAFKRLLHIQKVKAQLVLVGAGPRLEPMKALSRKLGIANSVFFTGATPLAPEIMMHSDIKALTSDLEGLSIALMEAALLKKPLIGTAGTGMEGLITHNQTGLLFKKRDSIDLADKLSYLIKNSNERRRLGQNAYDFVLEHCCRSVSEYKMFKLYYDALRH